MDEHTRKMFKTMSQRLTAGGGRQEIAALLNDDLQQLLQGCTMTGAAHEQLHLFLMPYMSAVKELSHSGSDTAWQTVNHALHDYQNYFE